MKKPSYKKLLWTNVKVAFAIVAGGIFVFLAWWVLIPLQTSRDYKWEMARYTESLSERAEKEGEKGK